VEQFDYQHLTWYLNATGWSWVMGCHGYLTPFLLQKLWTPMDPHGPPSAKKLKLEPEGLEFLPFLHGWHCQNLGLGGSQHGIWMG